MKFVCQPSELAGEIRIPGSKSHTIRAVMIAAMAEGESLIREPLRSADAEAAIAAARAFGATVELGQGEWRVRGVGPRPKPVPGAVVDVLNSGTTMQIALALASLTPGIEIEMTGDEQIRRRPVGPLVAALRQLGADVAEVLGNGCPPVRVRGGLRGGSCSIEAKTSQYLTALLLACPLAPEDTIVDVPLLNEAPYVQMTLDWLAAQKIAVEHDGKMRTFKIRGRQRYTPFSRAVPADFSTATFFLAAGALGPRNRTVSLGLDMADSQPDKAAVRYLREMGAKVVDLPNGGIEVSAPNGLHGVVIDMNETPDALPMMAVVGCFAEGETRLVNVAHARIKETDRIAVMAAELRKMGADIAELPDGLVIRRSQLHGAAVEGHGDHRVVMSLALAGLSCSGTTTVSTAEAAGVTCPTFFDFIRKLGGEIKSEE